MLGLKPGVFGQKVTVSAPISGKVLEMSVTAGEYRNDTTAPVMTIADLSTVWGRSDVPESAIRFIQPGEPIDVQLTAYPGETFHGRVTRIADTVDPQTRTIKVRAEMSNAHERLRPEMFGTIRHRGCHSHPARGSGGGRGAGRRQEQWCGWSRAWGASGRWRSKPGSVTAICSPVLSGLSRRLPAWWWTARCCCTGSREANP